MTWILSICIALFQFADYWTTLKTLERGGAELNPFMQMLFKGFGVSIGLLIGKFYVVVFILSGAYLGWFENKIGMTALVLMFGFYGVVVSHNLVQYRRM